MANSRAPGQTQIITMMKEEFVSEIEANLGKMGFSDRSAFIRTAVYEKMIREGVAIPKEFHIAPPRQGKGGAKYPRKQSSQKRSKI